MKIIRQQFVISFSKFTIHNFAKQIKADSFNGISDVFNSICQMLHLANTEAAYSFGNIFINRIYGQCPSGTNCDSIRSQWPQGVRLILWWTASCRTKMRSHQDRLGNWTKAVLMDNNESIVVYLRFKNCFKCKKSLDFLKCHRVRLNRNKIKD